MRLHSTQVSETSCTTPTSRFFTPPRAHTCVQGHGESLICTSKHEANCLPLPHSGYPTILRLASQVRGSNSSNLEQKIARANRIDEPK